VLVLDDYHLVTSAQVHASVATLLDRSPPQLHLTLITRADPPLPLSRLRVRGDLAEVRAEDLRFSPTEALEVSAPIPGRWSAPSWPENSAPRRRAPGRRD
jgi:LuxR family maltose regulon positive regulatory protein